MGTVEERLVDFSEKIYKNRQKPNDAAHKKAVDAFVELLPNLINPSIIYKRLKDDEFMWDRIVCSPRCVEAMLKYGADPCALGEYERTPLQQACHEPELSYDSCIMLVEEVRKLGRSKPLEECQKENKNIEENAVSTYINLQDEDNWDAFAQLCDGSGGSTEKGVLLMEYLLDNGVNPDGKSNNDDSYLHHCCENNNYNGAKLLIERGANVMYVNNSKTSVFHTCCAARTSRDDREKQLKLFDLLVEKGCDIMLNNKEKYNYTPIVEAAEMGNEDMVMRLLGTFGTRAKLNVTGEDKNVLKHLCYNECSVDCIKSILAHPDGPELTKESCNDEQWTPLMQACQHDTRLEGNAEKNVGSKAKWSPEEHEEIIFSLLVCDLPVGYEFDQIDSSVREQSRIVAQGNKKKSKNKGHQVHVDNSFSWPFVLSDTEDRFVDVIERVLNEGYNVRLLSQAIDKQGRRCIDTATPKCKAKILERLYLCARYELFPPPAEHKSKTCIVVYAIDHKSDDHKKVALKFMHHRDQFDREIQVRNELNLNEKMIIGILRTHDGDADKKFRQESDINLRDAGFIRNEISNAYYPYLLVMDRADRSLFDALNHEHFAGKDWDQITYIAKQIAQCAKHLHENGVVHGDMKPLNIVRVGLHWKLIDMDAVAYFNDNQRRIDISERKKRKKKRNKQQFVGAKYSSAYVPPELIRKDRSTGILSVKTYTPGKDEVGQPLEMCDDLLHANPSFDMWSFGCCLYHLCTDLSLFHADGQDNLNNENLKYLYQWTNSIKNKKLDLVQNRYARNLISQLLHKDPKKRPRSMKNVIDHPFLSGKIVGRLPGEEPAYDCFLSYRVSSDAHHVEHMYNMLVKRGIKPWWDKQCLEDGGPWEEGFCNGLAQSAIFIPFLSCGALSSMEGLTRDSHCDNVLLEFRLALDMRELGLVEKVFPLMIGEEIERDKDKKKNSVKIGQMYTGFDYSLVGKTSKDSVDKVNEKLRSHLNRQGLGSPIRKDESVSDTLESILQNQGMSIKGDVISVFELAVDHIVSLVEKLKEQKKVERKSNKEEFRMESKREKNMNMKEMRKDSMSTISTAQQSRNAYKISNSSSSQSLEEIILDEHHRKGLKNKIKKERGICEQGAALFRSVLSVFMRQQ